MKTRNLVLTAIAIIFASAVSAKKVPTLTVTQSEDNKVRVEFSASHPDYVSLSLKNHQGEVLYSKTTDTPVSELQTVFNFQYPTEEDYSVCMDYNGIKISRKFKMTNQGKMQIGEEMRNFSPYYSFKDNLLKVSYLNSNLENVHMSIYHEGDYLTTRNLGKTLSIQKAFDFSKLEKGQYEIVLSDVNNHYQFVFNK